ncbi:DNAJC28 family protein [Megaselia abdita]
MIISSRKLFFRIPFPYCHFTRTIKMTKAELYRKCLNVLGVFDENPDQTTVRRAYIDLVKKVHPDSGQPEASADKFQEIDEAFKILLERFAKSRRGIFEDDEEEVEAKIFDITHTAPQHRQYLSHDGMGVGNPFQREKQYQQIKAMKAQERVLSHRIEKSQADEKSIMKKGSFYKKHTIKTKYGFDRVVEDLIQEAMAKGDFDNLSSKGKPLTSAQTQNPYIDFTTHKLNKILLDNGFTPEWIMLQKDIREDVDRLKLELLKEREFLGNFPFKESDDINWSLIVKKFESDVARINKQIDKYNLIVPIIENQLFRVKLEKLAEKVAQNNTIVNRERTHKPNGTVDVKGPASKSDLFSFLGSLF